LITRVRGGNTRSAQLVCELARPRSSFPVRALMVSLLTFASVAASVRRAKRWHIQIPQNRGVPKQWHTFVGLQSQGSQTHLASVLLR
jgi:hypothetical protein